MPAGKAHPYGHLDPPCLGHIYALIVKTIFMFNLSLFSRLFILNIRVLFKICIKNSRFVVNVQFNLFVGTTYFDAKFRYLCDVYVLISHTVVVKRAKSVHKVFLCNDYMCMLKYPQNSHEIVIN